MATTMESSINVSALKLSDPYVKTIVDTAAHVALYSFNSESYEWEKLNVEGALFLCSRTGEPKHNLMILNRLNTYSFIEPIMEGLDLQLQDPFLLYRNVQGQINGIWFYDKDECVRIAKSIEKLVKDSSRSLTGNGHSFDAYNMITKPPDPPQQSKPDWDKLSSDGTSKRVMDFFAKASSNAPGVQGGYVAPPPGLPSQKNDVKPLLQRLMSTNPVHTVEQIEKQQRAVTPQKESPSLVKNRIPVNNKKESQKQNTKSRPMSLALDSTSPVCLSPQKKLENGLGFLSISSDVGQTSISPNNSAQEFFNTKFGSFVDEPLEVSELEKCVSTGLDSPLKPALIPPVMFASSAKKEEPPPPPISLNVRPEPLTKSQLLQAVTYLLKNDSDFINKLHEAYVKSFVDMVS